jgi:hypothetical protein
VLSDALRTIQFTVYFLNDVVGKVVAVVGLLGGCEMLQEGRDSEVEGELAVDLFCFPEPSVVAAGIGIEDDGFVAEDY